MASTLETVLAADVKQNGARYADAVIARVRLEVPELLSDPPRARLAGASTAALLDEFAEGLRLGLDRGFHAPPAAIAFARHLARDGVPLANVLRSYRLGQQAVFERAAELVGQTDESSPSDAVTRIALLSFRFTDAAMSDVATEYERERETLIRDAVARRDRIVRALLAGEPVDAGAAERTLGYRLNGMHLACVAWARPTAPTATIEHTVREVLEALGGRRSLLLGEPGGGLVAWTHVDADPRERRVVAAQALLDGTGVRVAVGIAAPGLSGFARGKRQADVARGVAALRDTPPLIRYGDVGLAALLLRDPEAAREFAAEELGSVAAPGRAGHELRVTLQAYLATGQDQTATASSLGMHRNTVSRRLRRAEQQLPRPLATRAQEVAAALTIVEWTGTGG